MLAAVRHLHGTLSTPEALVAVIDEDAERIRAVVLSRSTQTNEPARCTALLAALSTQNGPFALIDVGSAAGLCLLPDFYRYEFSGRAVGPRRDVATSVPTFMCSESGEAPVALRPPHIVWRRGIDRNPIDPENATECAWLETLVWPGQSHRLRNLQMALAVARRVKPNVVRGDCRLGLDRVLADAPSGATLVVFSSAAMVYIDAEARQEFSKIVREQNAIWVSLEAPGVLPESEALLRKDQPAGCFLLAVNEDPLAFCGPHGQYIQWIKRGVA